MFGKRNFRIGAIVLAVGFCLTAQTAFAQDVSYMLAANLTSTTKGNSTGNLTDPPANATTNEHSYQWGYKDAVQLYSQCWSDYVSGNDGCDWGNTIVHTDCSYATKHATITNSTACVHGFVHGWEHWCSGNEHACVSMILWGPGNERLPGELYTK